MNKRLRKKVKKKERNEMIWAIYDGQVEKIEKLISSGMDINGKAIF